jgi:hypothetical protein
VCLCELSIAAEIRETDVKRKSVNLIKNQPIFWAEIAFCRKLTFLRPSRAPLRFARLELAAQAWEA